MPTGPVNSTHAYRAWACCVAWTFRPSVLWQKAELKIQQYCALNLKLCGMIMLREINDYHHQTASNCNLGEWFHFLQDACLQLGYFGRMRKTCKGSLRDTENKEKAVYSLTVGHMVLVSHIETSSHGALTLAAPFVCSQLEAWITRTLITA